MLASILCLPLAQAHADEAFQRELERAAQLDVSASWQQTRELLDTLRPRLAQATDSQQGAFLLLDGRNLALSGDLDGALEVIDQALQRPLTLTQSIRAHGLGANIAMIARRYERSFELLGKGLALESDLQDSDGMVGLLTVASYIHAQAGQTQRAIDYGKRSLEFAERSGSLRNRCLAEQRIAFAYKKAETAELAERHYRSAIELCAEAVDPVFLGVSQSGLADLLRQAGRLEEAEAMFDQALAVLQQSGYSAGLAEALYYRAHLLVAQGRDAEAERALDGLAAHFRDNAQWDYLAVSQQMLAMISRRQGELDQALDFLAEALAANRQHVDRVRAMHLAYLGVEFDLQFKEQELALLREQARVAGLQEEGRRQQSRLQLLGATVAVLVAMVLAMLLLQARRERQRLLELSRLDGLTALHNHTAFFESVRQHLRTATGDGRGLTLFLADIDYFKQVNDQHGHPAGDQALRRVAGILRECFPTSASLGRVGGEEFAVCLHPCTLAESLELLQQFRNRLAAALPGPDNGVLTMSFGLARLRPGETLEQLRGRADAALYSAKHRGRDRVVVAQEPSLQVQTG
jgi:diguanylate cyclase (GGDEF)-like protein